MIQPSALLRVAALVLGGSLVFAASASAQGGQPLGSIEVTRGVLADGQPLAAGTYTLRASPEVPTPVVGETPSQSRWVEFVRDGKVVGKELAIVLTNAEIMTVVSEPGPEPGTSKTELLKGGDYLRIWVKHGGLNYLLHLVVPK
jgi:hypothetical protein